MSVIKIKISYKFCSSILAALLHLLFSPSLWALQETRPIVFMISGVAGSDFSSFAPYFEENGLDYRFIPGQWGGSIATRVRFSGEEINRILGNSQRPCAVIGHSYGGVVAREVTRTQLGPRCKLLISSVAAQASSPWANYVKTLALQAPEKLPEHLLAIVADLIFNINGTSPSATSINTIQAIFFLIRGFPKWDVGLKNWEKDFLMAMEDLETYKLTSTEQDNPELPAEVEVVSFGLSQKRKLPALNWPQSIVHRAIHRLAEMLEKIAPSAVQAQASNILNDGIIPTESMKLGPNFYCTEGSHFSGTQSLLYLGTYDLRGQLLKSYSSLAACKLLGTKQSCNKWQLFQKTFSACK